MRARLADEEAHYRQLAAELDGPGAAPRPRRPRAQVRLRGAKQRRCLDARCALRHDPIVSAQLRNWWKTTQNLLTVRGKPIGASGGVVEEAEYAEIFKKVYKAIEKSQTYKERGRRSRGETGVLAWAVDGQDKIAGDLGLTQTEWFRTLYRLVQRYLKGFARPCCRKQMALYAEANGDLSCNTRKKQVIRSSRRASPLLRPCSSSLSD